MALDTNANLQTAVLNWLIRPGDALISPSVPDMIVLFEVEARDRLKTRFNEAQTTLTTVAGNPRVTLPADYWELRSIKIEGVPTGRPVYMTPEQMDETWTGDQKDQPVNYTIEGLTLRLAPTPDTAYTIDLGYMQGLTGLASLGDGGTNWLLTRYPDLYLFGTLAEAEGFIADDERISGWLGRREAAFNRVSLTDIKARWSGSVLQIKTDVGNP